MTGHHHCALKFRAVFVCITFSSDDILGKNKRVCDAPIHSERFTQETTDMRRRQCGRLVLLQQAQAEKAREVEAGGRVLCSAVGRRITSQPAAAAAGGNYIYNNGAPPCLPTAAPPRIPRIPPPLAAAFSLSSSRCRRFP